jgi:hypothetical protein
MDEFSRNGANVHSLVLRYIPPVPSLRRKLHSVALGIFMQLKAVAPDPTTDPLGVFGSHGDWNDAYVFLKHNTSRLLLGFAFVGVWFFSKLELFLKGSHTAKRRANGRAVGGSGLYSISYTHST